MDSASQANTVPPQNLDRSIKNKSAQTETKDPYSHEGAVEQDKPNQNDNTSMNGQMGHRNKPADLDTLDTDFPEPGENPEHSGE